jgi:hypothetical protein
VIALLLAIELLAAAAGVQNSSASPVAGSRTVLATVLDGRNRATVDVGVDDFVVKEAGRTRDVLDVRVADYPVAVLVDTSAAAGADFEAIKAAAARFITRIGQRPVALGTLADPPGLLTKFDDERSVLNARLASLSADPSAESVVFQAVANASGSIHELGAPFSAIVVISANPLDATRQPSGAVLTPIHDSGAIVHVIGNRSASNRPDDLATHNADMLRTLASDTHGQFIAIYSAASYQIALDRLADRLSTEMMIQYIVPSAAAAAAPSDVKVGVRLPGARVLGLGVK